LVFAVLYDVFEFGSAGFCGIGLVFFALLETFANLLGESVLLCLVFFETGLDCAFLLVESHNLLHGSACVTVFDGESFDYELWIVNYCLY
jgi:hypothetical protein